MLPKFAAAIDPIFVAAVDIESRIARGENVVTAVIRDSLVRKIEEAEGKLGTTDEWKLSKYAICAWIDSRLIEIPWQQSGWWKDNCLEKKFFGTRDAHEEFFTRANEADALPGKNALEVFYLAVVLGFRGFYANSNSSYARQTADRLRVPDTVERWCDKTVRKLHLRQGRPAISNPVISQGTNKPLNGKHLLLLYAMLSCILVAIACACAIFLYGSNIGAG